MKYEAIYNLYVIPTRKNMKRKGGFGKKDGRFRIILAAVDPALLCWLEPVTCKSSLVPQDSEKS